MTTDQKLDALIADVKEIKGDICELKGDIRELKEDVRELKTRVSNIERKVDYLYDVTSYDRQLHEAEKRLKAS